MMRTRIGTNEYLCPFYLVGLKTYGGGNHNHKHVRNKLSLFDLFLLGNMDNLNVTCGCPGLSFINAAERVMAFLNIGIFVIALISNAQVGDELLMDEVIGNILSMKLVREAVQEYDTYLPLDIDVLERCLGCNAYVAASTSTDGPAVITEDVNYEEEI